LVLLVQSTRLRLYSGLSVLLVQSTRLRLYSGLLVLLVQSTRLRLLFSGLSALLLPWSREE
jgi:hypothetical protein